MTRLSPSEVCLTCGTPVVPTELSFNTSVPSSSEYVCLKCGRFYRWAGSPPRLTALLAAPPVQAEQETRAMKEADRHPDPELRLLFIEDNADDAELEARELRAAGLRFVSERVWTEPEFLGVMEEFRPD